ncbi:MAG: DUF3810 domain-containing protein [Gemmiger sp.]|nr:DUF3810 domain-containing protein [Gemmiger sp.]
MQNIQQRLRRGVAAHKAGLALLGAGCLAVCLFWLARGQAALMAWWVATVSMPYKWGVSALADAAPFSLCEAGATLLLGAVAARLGYTLWLLVARRQNRLGAWLLHTATAGVWVYALVCAFWGTQYYIPGFAANAGMVGGPVATADLQAVTGYFAAQVNDAATDANRTAVDKQSVLRDTAFVYTALEGEYPFLAGPVRRAKPAVYSKLMSAAGFTGYLCPLFGESTLNTDCPAVFLPVTVAHELAHQRGVAAEQEANFCGIRAAVTCGEPCYAYSGWLFGYLYLSNALYRADATAATASYATLCETAQADLAENNAYWAGWQGPAKTAGETVYTTFLKGYGQPLGMQSYGACVDSLVEYYAPLAVNGQNFTYGRPFFDEIWGFALHRGGFCV